MQTGVARSQVPFGKQLKVRLLYTTKVLLSTRLYKLLQERMAVVLTITSGFVSKLGPSRYCTIPFGSERDEQLAWSMSRLKISSNSRWMKVLQMLTEARRKWLNIPNSIVASQCCVASHYKICLTSYGCRTVVNHSGIGVNNWIWI